MFACIGFHVALRKESVDRNVLASLFCVGFSSSLSARRAWIEIENNLSMLCSAGVALRKESVDRNICVIEEIIAFNRRSPQGERG